MLCDAEVKGLAGRTNHTKNRKHWEMTGWMLGITYFFFYLNEFNIQRNSKFEDDQDGQGDPQQMICFWNYLST